jgi:hypothetical protein
MAFYGIFQTLRQPDLVMNFSMKYKIPPHYTQEKSIG